MINNSSTLSSWWNNFNNGDEALFNNASLPRDSYGFKIQPWMQSDKLDWRESNKNIDFKQCLAKSAAVKTASWWVADDLAYFKESYTAKDLADISSFVPRNPSANTHPISWWQNVLKAQKRWDSWVTFKDWNAVITANWSYIIQAWCMFQFPDWYTTADSYLYKEYVALKQYVDKEWVVITKNQARACSTADLVIATHVTWADKWDILNVWFSHTYWSAVLCQPVINIYRL